MYFISYFHYRRHFLGMRTLVSPSPSRQRGERGNCLQRHCAEGGKTEPKTAASAQVSAASPGPATPNLQIQFLFSLSLCPWRTWLRDGQEATNSLAAGPQGQEMKSWMLSSSVPFSCNLVSLGISLFPSFVLKGSAGWRWGLLLEPLGKASSRQVS